MLRGGLASFAIWAAVLQVGAAGTPHFTLDPENAAALMSVACGLAGFTVMVYRLGIWRQEMHNLKHSVGAEIARYREESNRNFERLDRRLDTVDRTLASMTEQRVGTERWQSRMDNTVSAHDQRLDHLEEGAPRDSRDHAERAA